MLKVKQDSDLKKSLLGDYNNYRLKTMKDKNQYNLLANLFRYPQVGYKEQMLECGEMLQNYYPVAYQEFLPFLNVMNEKSIVDIEELFGKTFHIQAICYLDLGYVLYAEDYKRGDFLVQMKNEQRMANNDCGVELADNLPNALTLLPLLKDETFLEELVVRMYIPALESMVKEFEQSRIDLKTKVRKKKQKVLILEDMPNKNAFQSAIQATINVLQTDFNVIKYKDQEAKADPLSSFLPNCVSSCATTTTEEPAKTN